MTRSVHQILHLLNIPTIHIIKKNVKRRRFSIASKEIRLEVNADKTKYMVMSRDQNAGRSHSIKTDNSSFERVEGFKYLGITLTNQNSIQEEGSKESHNVINVIFALPSFSFQRSE